MKVIFHPKYLEHSQFSGHPERPERLEGILALLEQSELVDDIVIPDATEERNLLLVHTDPYVFKVKNSPPGYLDGGDTYLSESTYEIAKLAVGGALLSTKFSSQKKKNIALLRPPGHHAGADYGGGFCYFNNIAIGARYADMKRIAIIDLDAHHGNGTSDIFYKDPSALYMSVHHHGIYPGTGEKSAVGEGPGEGFNVNIPFRAGAGDASIKMAFESLLEPILLQYDPDMIFVSLGTDGHYIDGMTGLSLSSQAYVDSCKRLSSLADDICGGKISFMLEGGYHIPSLAEIITHLVGPEGADLPPLKYTEVSDKRGKGKAVVEETVDIMRKYWDL